MNEGIRLNILPEIPWDLSLLVRRTRAKHCKNPKDSTSTTVKRSTAEWEDLRPFRIFSLF